MKHYTIDFFKYIHDTLEISFRVFVGNGPTLQAFKGRIGKFEIYSLKNIRES